jgi:hypothetical protein
LWWGCTGSVGGGGGRVGGGGCSGGNDDGDERLQATCLSKEMQMFCALLAFIQVFFHFVSSIRTLHILKHQHSLHLTAEGQLERKSSVATCSSVNCVWHWSIQRPVKHTPQSWSCVPSGGADVCK